MTLEAVIHEPGSGETLSLRGTKVRVLTTAATSVGAATFEFVAAPGWDTGSHFHSKIEEQFYVIDGELELRAGAPDPDEIAALRARVDRTQVSALST
jgi:quercetin dioxygenase-like cupin family protein